MDLRCERPWGTTPDRKFFRCGSCQKCKVFRQLQWHSRLSLEAAYNSAWPLFLTLTYSDEFLPGEADAMVGPKKFWKRLRKAGHACRYFVVTERGGVNSRLHHHAIVWLEGVEGWTSKRIWTLLSSKWKYGFVGPKNGFHRGKPIRVQKAKALRYTAKYVQKDSLRYAWSSRPMLGSLGIQRWRSLVTDMHTRKPFTDIREVPAFLRKNVLNQATSIRIPERNVIALVKELGVPYGPERLNHHLFGGPNCPDSERNDGQKETEFSTSWRSDIAHELSYCDGAGIAVGDPDSPGPARVPQPHTP